MNGYDLVIYITFIAVIVWQRIQIGQLEEALNKQYTAIELALAQIKAFSSAE